MKYLLDTCVLVFYLAGDRKRLGEFFSILENPSNYVAISVVSYWEIVIKESTGKLKIRGDLLPAVEASGFSWLNLNLSHITALQSLPKLHADPFDRLLIAQAKAEKFKFLTLDDHLPQYWN